MTDIRELLLEATSDVRVDEPNPVARVRRATSRHLLRLVAATTAVVAVVAGAGIAIGHTRTTGNTELGRPQGQLETWAATKGDLVTTGLGFAWTTDTVAGETLAQRDLRTGSVIGTFNMAQGAHQLTVGAGRVWALGADQPSSAGVINIVNPTTGSVKTLFLRGVNERPAAIAFAAGSAWVSFQSRIPSRGQVWRLTPTAAGVAKSVIHVNGGAQGIATTGDGQVWAQRSDGSIIQVLPTRTGGRLGPTSTGLNLIASSPLPDTILTAFATHVDEVQPGRGGCTENCATTKKVLPVRGIPQSIASTPAGLFISSESPSIFRGFTEFFSNAALASAHPEPTATTPHNGAVSPDGDGVLISSARGITVRWTPKS